MKLRTTLFSLLVLAYAANYATAGEPKRPTVLFIALDDMNDWTILLDPTHPIRTPNLQRLASRGVFFSQAYTASPA